MCMAVKRCLTFELENSSIRSSPMHHAKIGLKQHKIGLKQHKIGLKQHKIDHSSARLALASVTDAIQVNNQLVRHISVVI